MSQEPTAGVGQSLDASLTESLMHRSSGETPPAALPSGTKATTKRTSSKASTQSAKEKKQPSKASKASKKGSGSSTQGEGGPNAPPSATSASASASMSTTSTPSRRAAAPVRPLEKHPTSLSYAPEILRMMQTFGCPKTNAQHNRAAKLVEQLVKGYLKDILMSAVRRMSDCGCTDSAKRTLMHILYPFRYDREKIMDIKRFLYWKNTAKWGRKTKETRMGMGGVVSSTVLPRRKIRKTWSFDFVTSLGELSDTDIESDGECRELTPRQQWKNLMADHVVSSLGVEEYMEYSYARMCSFTYGSSTRFMEWLGADRWVTAVDGDDEIDDADNLEESFEKEKESEKKGDQHSSGCDAMDVEEEKKDDDKKEKDNSSSESRKRGRDGETLQASGSDKEWLKSVEEVRHDRSKRHPRKKPIRRRPLSGLCLDEDVLDTLGYLAWDRVGMLTQAALIVKRDMTPSGGGSHVVPSTDQQVLGIGCALPALRHEAWNQATINPTRKTIVSTSPFPPYGGPGNVSKLCGGCTLPSVGSSANLGRTVSRTPSTDGFLFSGSGTTIESSVAKSSATKLKFTIKSSGSLTPLHIWEANRRLQLHTLHASPTGLLGRPFSMQTIVRPVL
eukprot:TRINITY_DN1333_c0_g1_i1.p1 TRINITY_DN1333_c0_g1~~TRINITY_DN1333_c0_g1_i1.p1  ORF type:complete len:636 (+),score=138.88 TRINITY_DN1333_c0_g1_i1:59-1909(+)